MGAILLVSDRVFYDILKIGAFFGGASFVNLKKSVFFEVFLLVLLILLTAIFGFYGYTHPSSK